MPYVFISQSAIDMQQLAPLKQAFEGTGVEPFIFDGSRWAPPAARRIAEAIRSAIAVFVVIGPTASDVPHTRSWIAWECGVAYAYSLPIYVIYPWAHQSPSYPPIPVCDYVLRTGLSGETVDALRLLIRGIGRGLRAEATQAFGVRNGFCSGCTTGFIVVGDMAPTLCPTCNRIETLRVG